MSDNHTAEKFLQIFTRLGELEKEQAKVSTQIEFISQTLSDIKTIVNKIDTKNSDDYKKVVADVDKLRALVNKYFYIGVGIALSIQFGLKYLWR